MIIKQRIKKIALLISLQSMAMPVMAQSLEQAIAQTLSSNPEIRSAYNEFMSRNELIDASTGDYLPSVDLEAGIGYEDYDNKLGTKGEFDPRNAKISIRQLLWDGSITYNDIQRNKAETEAQRYQLLSDAQDMALTATESYLDVLRAQEILALSEANFAVHQRMYSDIKKRADSGIGSTADLAQVAGRLARSNTNLLSAKSNLNDKNTAFIRTIGAYPEALEKPEVDINYVAISLDDAMEKARKNNPVIYVASNDIEAAQQQYEQAKGTFYPSFSIEASQEWGEELDGSRGDTDEFKAMLKMRYNLYNGGSDAAKSRRAAYQINKSKDVRDRAHRMLDEGTRLAWSAMELASDQTKFLQEHVDASARTVIAYEKQFRIGKRTLLDVLNTENELFESRKAYLNAHYSGILAKYRVLNATGLLLDEMRVDVPESWVKTVK
ncbi:agglutination protein [Photobacterium profundum]|jgi:outer membrane protein, adhesin transport system|uniref:Putative agglutination protein n=1 Tax=Photobacterium profundum 3TCK TaxID=314280 RepID=Q1Z6W9_9GAMM|nr:TolC family outer membrane protein [Photobacterium profundum]EAS44334.1 putative agglutination protein [Photobacterium profundum 3TCK]PSV62910.1 agglutination protein [Photobacterium profundum]